MWAIYTSEPDGVKVFLEGAVYQTEGSATNKAKEMTQKHGRFYMAVEVDASTAEFLMQVEGPNE